MIEDKKAIVLENAKISILISEDSTTIELIDSDSGLQFVSIKLSPEQLSMVLSRRAHVPCTMTIRSLDKIGKKLEHKIMEFEIPEDADRNGSMVSSIADSVCPAGWVHDNYFNSQNSFFHKDGHRFARCTIRRWV